MIKVLSIRAGPRVAVPAGEPVTRSGLHDKRACGTPPHQQELRKYSAVWSIPSWHCRAPGVSSLVTGIAKIVTPHTLRHAFITAVSMPEYRCVTCRKPPRMPIRALPCGMTGLAAAWTGMRPTSSPPTSQGPPGNTPADLSSASGGSRRAELPGHRSDHLAAATLHNCRAKGTAPRHAELVRRRSPSRQAVTGRRAGYAWSRCAERAWCELTGGSRGWNSIGRPCVSHLPVR